MNIRNKCMFFIFCFVFLLSGCGGGGGGGGETSSSITSIQAYPDNIFLASGQTEQVRVTAKFEDGTTSDITKQVVWENKNSYAASISDSGKVVGLNRSKTELIATYKELTSNSISVDVTDAVLDRIQLLPATVSIARGQGEQLEALAVYSDKTTSNIINQVAWVSSDNTIAQVDPSSGLLVGTLPGNLSLTATYKNLTSNSISVNVSDAVITNLQVTPPLIVLPEGESEALTLKATYSDSTTSNLNDQMLWSYSNIEVAEIDSEIVLKAKSKGTTSITGSYQGVNTNQLAVVVTDAAVTQLEIAPSNITIANGQEITLIAKATFSNGTSLNHQGVNWSTGDSKIIIIDSQSGLLQAVGVGTTSVTVVLENNPDITHSVEVVVTEAVVSSIEIEARTGAFLPQGESEQLIARVTYSDGSSFENEDSVYWSSSNLDVALIDSNGVLYGRDTGITYVSATARDAISGEIIKSNEIEFEVTDALVDEINIVPSDVISLAKGLTKQLVAEVTYSDGRTKKETDTVNWSFNTDTNVATINNAGLLTAASEGSAKIYASKVSDSAATVFSNEIDLLVTKAEVTSITIEPSPIKLTLGDSIQLKALAIFTDNNVADIAQSVDIIWEVVDSGLAGVKITPKGYLTAENSGGALISVTYDGSDILVKGNVEVSPSKD
nr:Ig-like domain-containing protein [Vibrio cyclitrophicus]OEF33261.1 hypothetical protein OA7_14325 [Vibrio cyclitrophicus 1F53]